MVVDFRRTQRDHEQPNTLGKVLGPSGDREEHQIPRCPPAEELDLVPQLRLHCEESPAASPLPEKAEKSSPSTPHSHHFLQRDYRELPG